jgi:GNAT superfamily N-acetyltransferase
MPAPLVNEGAGKRCSMERAMIRLQPDEFSRHSDVLRARRGDVITLRFAMPADAEALQAYVRSLSAQSRASRFLGAVSELPKAVLDDFTHPCAGDRFSVLATIVVDGLEQIIGEARYALHADDSLEFGLSIHDRWQGAGLGAALMTNLECRAAALGALSMFADTLRTNHIMIALARKSGYGLVRHPDDWRLLRFEKQVAYAPAEIPCASWRLAVQLSHGLIEYSARRRTGRATYASL